jgi:hypothetical protein
MTEKTNDVSIIPFLIAIAGCCVGFIMLAFVFSQVFFAHPYGVGDVVACSDYVTITEKTTRMESDGEHYFVETTGGRYEINGWDSGALNKHYWEKIPEGRQVRLYRGLWQSKREGGYGYAVLTNVTDIPNPNWRGINYCVVIP